jgi:PAS domain-containing protein
MRLAEIEAFRDVPFLCWAKDENGKYLWCNQAGKQLAGEEVVGKTDRDLVWAESADQLLANDQKVFQSGKPVFSHEKIDQSKRGGATLNVCKWLGDLDGKKCCFGISFTID